MSVSSSIMIEQPCYTLVNLPQDAELPTEMKLREDLEKGDNKVAFLELLFKDIKIKI
jgi:hypothetical protein